MEKLLFLFLLITPQCFCQQPVWKNIDTRTNATFRSLSVVDDSVAWVGGTNGWIGRSTNGGNDWAMKQVKGFEKCDFRSLYAIDAKNAVIANAGSPAYILRTKDGGLNWQVVYKNDDTAAFFDGIDFWNYTEGIIYGDPLKGRMMVLRTTDGGLNWLEMPEQYRPALEKGEASFAASGTSIRCRGKSNVVIATGGAVSRLFISTDRGKEWKIIKTPIIQGENSTGIFSVAFIDENNGIIVGGDYKKDTLAKDHVFYTKDGGKTWQKPVKATRGYRECVTYIDPKTAIATGPTGTDISYDGGINWNPLQDEKKMHVIRKSRKGNLVILAGSGGKIALLGLK